MSDSDSTWPATDDFESRFLEIDEFECPVSVQAIPDEVTFELPDEQIISPMTTDEISPAIRRNEGRRARDSRRRSYLAMERGKEDDGFAEPNIRRTSNRFRRAGNRNLSKPESDLEGAEDEEFNNSTSNFSKPKPLTARQRMIQMQRDNDTVISTDSNWQTLENLETPKATITPTPEQLVARQRTIERRRESAKNRVELQKRQTVERLLKINADSDGFGKRTKGRGFRGRVFPSSGSTASLLSAVSNISGGNEESESSTTAALSSRIDEDEDSNLGITDEFSDTDLLARISLAKQHGLNESSMDPPQNYIRCISSAKLSPLNRVSFPPNHDSSFFTSVSSEPSQALPTRLCGLGCGRPRRYSCSATGISLCSLACYKQHMASCSKKDATFIVT